jgi:hypothetical protein
VAGKPVALPPIEMTLERQKDGNDLRGKITASTIGTMNNVLLAVARLLEDPAVRVRECPECDKLFVPERRQKRHLKCPRQARDAKRPDRGKRKNKGGSHWWAKLRVAGKVVRVSTGCAKKRAAQDWLDIRAGKIAEGSPLPVKLDSTLYDELHQDLLTHYETIGRLTPATTRLLQQQRERVVALVAKLNRLIPDVFVHEGKSPLQGRRVREFNKAWKSACEEAGYTGTLLHDLRRSGVRAMVWSSPAPRNRCA